MTGLCHGDVVLSSVLAEEETFLALKETCQVQAAYGHIDL